MGWIGVKLFIGNIYNLGGRRPLKAKRERLLEYVDPLTSETSSEKLRKEWMKLSDHLIIFTKAKHSALYYGKLEQEFFL